MTSISRRCAAVTGQGREIASKNRTAALIALLALSAALCSAPALAQPYPVKPERIIVPYAPGGGIDIMARIAAQKYGERIGAQFVVDMRAGGGTIIGTEIVAQAAADGYTLLFANPGLTSSMALNQKLPFDPVQSFAPGGLFASSCSRNRSGGSLTMLPKATVARRTGDGGVPMRRRHRSCAHSL